MARRSKPSAQALASRIEVNIQGNNAYREARREGHRMDPRLRVLAILAVVLAIVYLVGLIVPRNMLNSAVHYGATHDGYNLAWFVSDLTENVNGLFAVLTGNVEAGVQTANRMVAYAVIALAGAGLALCGAVYQGTFRNALVSPSTLGVMSGASLGMAAWVALFYDSEQSHGLWFEGAQGAAADPLVQLWNSYGLSLCAFVGCFVVVGLVVLAVGMVGRGSSSGIMMIVTGQVIGSVMGAVTSAIRYYYITVDPEGPQADMLMELQVASFFRGYSLVDVFAVGLPVLVMFAFVMANRQQLTLLAFSEAEARTMGVETRRLRIATVCIATLATAVIVSFCGRIGFVGFLVPHLARRLVGPNFAYLMPVSLVLGGAFVLASFVLVTMTLGEAYATMTGAFVSVGGAAVFLATALRGGGGERGAF